MKKYILAVSTAMAVFALCETAEARRYSQNTQYSEGFPNTESVAFGEDQYPGWTFDSSEGWRVSSVPHFRNARQARHYYKQHNSVAYNHSSIQQYAEHALGEPSSSIVAYGHMLQGQGLRVSEHPSFGGVHHVHSHHSAHYSGRAIDVNVGTGVVEAHSGYAHKFDQVAAAARSAGYKVLWRVAGHYDHIHIQY